MKEAAHMTDKELKAGVAAILIYETIEQNNGQVPSALINCTINNVALEKVLQICAHIDVEMISRLIANSRQPDEQ